MESPSLMRRFAAMLYDSLLIIALLMVTMIPMVVLNNGEAVGDRWWTFPYMVTIVFGFFFGFWRKAGQTLGMRTWRIKLIDQATGNTVSFSQAFIRFAVAIPSLAFFGVGYIWLLFDKEKLSMPDRASGTRLILLEKVK